MNETEMIVAWLRERSDKVFDNGYYGEALQLSDAADAIENGEHRQHSPATVKDS